MPSIIISLSVFFLFLIFGIIFSSGKGAFLIAGYNTMPAREKEKYDEVSLCKFMGKMMYSLCFCLLMIVLGDLFQNMILLVTGILLFVSVVVFTIVYGNTGNRFKREST
ncbi:DUF3784 domain-containing protein [Sporosarcina sp. OR05]|uniref:DUF3784 domain-containing protein n=1 Tax=Sporosarcina sp. OR05 TaxID=2969819 RepID=UPI00352A3C18